MKRVQECDIREPYLLTEVYRLIWYERTMTVYVGYKEMKREFHREIYSEHNPTRGLYVPSVSNLYVNVRIYFF